MWNRAAQPFVNIGCGYPELSDSCLMAGLGRCRSSHGGKWHDHLEPTVGAIGAVSIAVGAMNGSLDHYLVKWQASTSHGGGRSMAQAEDEGNPLSILELHYAPKSQRQIGQGSHEG